MSSRPWRIAATLAAAGALVVTTIPAFADNVVDNVSGTGPVALTLSGASTSTTITYQINSTGDPGDGGNVCNATPANPAKFNVVTNGTGTASVTSDVSELSFTGCGTSKSVVYTATSAGTRRVELTYKSGAGASYFNLVATRADLTITQLNTAPSVAVTGFAPDEPFEYPAAPTPGCDVSDSQDDNQAVEGDETTATPVVTGPVGTYSSLGLGEYTVTCSYTDLGDPAIAGTDDQSLTTTATRKYTRNDTTDPTLNTPGDQSLEANDPRGAQASWTVDGSDAVGLAGPATCDVASGSWFDLGVHTINCTVTDLTGHTTNDSFKVTVTDSTAPSIVAPSNPEPVEATSADGAVVTYADPTATDLYDPNPVVTCAPASGSIFVLGTTTVTCSATDSEGNTSDDVTFDVKVVDTTPPTVEEKDDVTAEATGPGGAAVAFDKPTASDIVDGATEVVCDAESGDTFPLGTTTVSCSSTDAAGNIGYGSFDVIVEDTTPPVIDAHDDVTAQATGPSGANVDYTTPAANDLVDGSVAVSCDPAPGVQVAVDGSQLVTCTATDAAGNSAQSSFTLYVVDTTAPTLNLPDDINTGATSASGAVVSYTATGEDLVDGTVAADCTPTSGSTFAPGTTTVTCTATDSRGNTSAAETFDVTVSFAFNGFFAPVDNGGVLNTIKGGQSVPMKWAIPNGSGGFISSLSVVERVTQSKFTCTAGAPTDAIEAPTSGATSLRYDTTANQYIYNWQSPKGANSCYKVTVYLTDGTSKSASFMTK